LGSVAAAAENARAGWELSGTTYPSNLVPGVNHVSEVVSSEAAGPFKLIYEGQETAPIPFGSAPVTVQSNLEALSSIGTGNVSVAAAATPGIYTVTFVGALASMQGHELEASGASAVLKRKGGASGTIGVNIFNVGAAGSVGAITVTDTLPPGVKAKEAGELEIAGMEGERGSAEGWGVDPRLGHEYWQCSGDGPGVDAGVAGATTVTCVNTEGFSTFRGGGGLPISGGANPQPPIGIAVEAGADAPALTNRIAIGGGGALAPASTHNTITVGPVPAHSGLMSWDAWASNANGTIDTQAGSHPYEMTTVYNLATETPASGQREGFLVDGELQNLEATLPPGFIGNLASVPQCSAQRLALNESGGCPVASMVGTLKAQLIGQSMEATHPVFNMVPPPGEPAQLGVKILGVTVRFDFSVRTGGDDGITVHINNLAQTAIDQAMLTIWGVPGDHSHDRWRTGHNGGCRQAQLEQSPVGENEETESYCSTPQFPVLTPILTLPTACGEPQPFLIRELGAWQDPAARSEAGSLSHDANDNPTGFTGCENLSFGPSISVLAETAIGDSPSGLTAEVKPGIGGLEETTSLGSADIADATVTLPPGFAVNPGQASGLQTCSRQRAALENLPNGEENDGPASCPASSKLGTVLVKSPLIEGAEDKQLEGGIYLLPSSPPELKLLATASADGVNVKLVGSAHLNEETGQITTTFEGTPQMPASLFKLTFAGGAQATLVTPATCGVSDAVASFTPWSSPFLANFVQDAPIAITEGAGGGACPSGALPFAPSLSAGVGNTQAGGYTSFSATLTRGDGQQRVQTLQIKMPKGLAGILANVPLCGEPQAAAGTCGSASQVGHAVVTAGPGAYPLTIPQPGAPEISVYLTGPYRGAPFGLSIVAPIVAGPFNLGTIVTRARIEVDPHTAQVTVTSDPLPQIVKGVPTDLRQIAVTIDKSSFTYNPTNCAATAVTGTATSTGGASSQVSSRFQVGGCRELPFKPTFKVSTQAKTSKKGGASLDVKVTSNRTQANIGQVAVTLPKQLPSRLSTIQQACPDATFNANPASCPAGANIGIATAVTPVLSSPLTGPAYLVSHGGAGFPDLVLILQGEGVKLELVGSIDIKHGVTSSAFNSVPDAPISTFELKLPEGPHSGLAAVLPAKAKGSLCGTSLVMPTTLTGQNGAVVKQNTKIAVTGCTKAKHRKKTKHRKTRKG
jgi:hypothetical protein